MLKKRTYPIQEAGLKPNIDKLNKHFKNLCILNSNTEANKNQPIQNDILIAIGRADELLVHSGSALNQLERFCESNSGRWLFGYISYDLKNEIEDFYSENTDGIEFPLLHFFVPEMVVQMKHDTVIVFFDDSFVTEEDAANIYQLAIAPDVTFNSSTKKIQPLAITPRISKEKYISAVNQLKQHIQSGDIYEINFCQEFYAENVTIDTADTYNRLNSISRAPFSAYYRIDNHFLMCSSPERFIQKRSNRLISQPIKGTAKRSENEKDDLLFKEQLKNSVKEKSENVMIVDLVRNDLSKVAKRGSVTVDEICGIYSFKQVHQMISTISCELKKDVAFTDIIKSTFPMGSMTGAPKVRAMQLIEKYESTKRGLYSGTVGYISPEGDFDFNVVIRSILYNRANKQLSFMVGSAITDKSDAESEYEECLLKAKAMFDVLK